MELRGQHSNHCPALHDMSQVNKITTHTKDQVSPSPATKTLVFCYLMDWCFSERAITCCLFAAIQYGGWVVRGSYGILCAVCNIDLL